MTGDQKNSDARPSRLRQDKRRAILDAAAHVFMRDGFGLAGIDEIVAESGVSKRTLYAHFPSKEALFGAIIREWCDDLLTPLRHPQAEDQSPRETLIALGRTFLTVILSAQGLSLYRVVVAEAPRFPELGRVFFNAGHEPAATLLAGYIGRMTERGVFRAVDAHRVAEAFFGVMCGYMHDRMLLGINDQTTADEIDAHLALTAGLFLDGLSRHSAVIDKDRA